MLLPLLLALLPYLAFPAPADHRDEIRAVGKDVDKLAGLARKWSADGDEPAANEAWTKLLEVDPANEEAHLGLRHHRYAETWFETYTELYRFRREEDARMLAEKGLVRLRDGWVPKEDEPYLRLGFVRDDEGAWCNPATVSRLAHEKELAAQGCEQQDLTWIPPSEFDSWRQQLWKCGDRWLDQPGADRYHAEIETWWEAPSEHFVVCGTLDRASLEWAKWYADRTYDDLVRIFGVRPGSRPTTLDLLGPGRDKPTVVVLRSIDQYNVFAAGDAARQLPTTELDGFSSLHYAYFASAWFDARAGAPAHRGSGVAFWDRSDETLAPFGQHAIRHAAAQSYVEAIDPSLKAIAASGNSIGGFATQSFWEEKRVPRWLRYGAASYCERYFVDAEAKDGVDPRWARTWGFENLARSGGLGDLADVFAFELSLQDLEGSTKRIHEAGAIVAFVLDGGDAKVAAAHAAFREALAGGGDTSEAVQALQGALVRSERALKAFVRP